MRNLLPVDALLIPVEADMKSDWYLRPDTIRDLLSARHCPMQVAAAELRLSRGYWSRLANGRKAASTTVRWRILNSPLFAGVSPDVLWEKR